MKKMVKPCSDAVKANSFNVKMTRTDKIKVGGKNFRVHTSQYDDALIAMLFSYTMISAHLSQ